MLVEALVADAVSRGLSPIWSILGQKAKGWAAVEDEVSKRLRSDQDFAAAAGKWSATIIALGPGDFGRNDIVAKLLRSDEVHEILRQIFAVELAEDRQDYMNVLRAKFRILANANLQKDCIEPATVDLEGLFNLLLIGSQRALHVLAMDGHLAALDRKSTYCTRLILDELHAIRKSVDRGLTVSPVEVQEYATRIRSQMMARHGYIRPPNVESGQRIALDEIYVAPTFKIVARAKTETDIEQRLLYPEFVSGIYRVVVLGNPGGGKSTFAQKLTHDLTHLYDRRLIGGRLLTPFLVTLRHYGEKRQSEGVNILEYIERICKTDYQIPPPSGFIDYLLRSGGGIVIFDGLDELLDSTYRREVTADIESFCNLYPSSPIVVTSRKVGYEQAPLDPARFQSFLLSDFTDEQVAEYAKKWFALNSDRPIADRDHLVEAFIRDSMVVPAIRTNPLMLALICNIYNGENYIPKNRPGVYEKCAEMLFEKWDRSRGIRAPLPIDEAHVRNVLNFLAHWIYSEVSRQNGVPERKLIAATRDYLNQRLIEDRERAERAATDFIAFCKGRAWVLAETGTTAAGEGLYQFVHGTFLEYFTAAQLVRSTKTPADLAEILRPRIAKREWDVVAQLAYQIKDNNTDGAADEFIEDLIEASSRLPRSSDPQVWNLLSFACRSLSFLVPRPAVSRKLTRHTWERCCQWAAEGAKDLSPRTPERRMESVIAELTGAAAENVRPVADALLESIELDARGEDDHAKHLAMEVLLILPRMLLLPTEGRRLTDSELTYWLKEWESLLGRLREEHLHPYLKQNKEAALSALTTNIVTTRDVITWHGLPALFNEYGLRFMARHEPSVADLALYRCLVASQHGLRWHRRFDVESFLREFRLALKGAKSAWGPSRARPSSVLLWAVGGGEELEKRNSQLTAEHKFPAVVLLSTLLEADLLDVDNRSNLREWIQETNLSVVTWARPWLLRRMGDSIHTEAASIEMTPEEQVILEAWSRRERNFARRRKASPS